MAISISVLRSVIIAALGWWLARTIANWLSRIPGQYRWLVWIAILAPFFTPTLVTGYCYRDTALAMVHVSWAKELLYAVIITAQVVPVAVVVLWYSPSAPASDSALYLTRNSRLTITERIRLILQSAKRYDIAAFSVIFLLAFQESEFASLVQARGWTEWLFTRHVQGLKLSETIRLTIPAMCVQLPFLFPVVLWMNDHHLGIQRYSPPIQSSRVKGGVAVLWLLIATTVVCVIPIWQLFRSASWRAMAFVSERSFQEELGDSILVMVTTTAVVLGLWALLTRWKRLRASVLLLLFLPGSLGSLSLGVILLGLFQTTPLQWAYDSPVPLVLGEVLFLLPRTWILFWCLNRSVKTSANHQVELLKGSSNANHQQRAAELSWFVSGRYWFLGLCLVGFWSYMELMLKSLLVFPGMAPISLVLYNAMHYGRIGLLGAKLFAALVFPGLCLFIFLQTRRLWVRYLGMAFRSKTSGSSTPE